MLTAVFNVECCFASIFDVLFIVVFNEWFKHKMRMWRLLYLSGQTGVLFCFSLWQYRVLQKLNICHEQLVPVHATTVLIISNIIYWISSSTTFTNWLGEFIIVTLSSGNLAFLSGIHCLPMWVGWPVFLKMCGRVRWCVTRTIVCVVLMFYHSHIVAIVCVAIVCCSVVMFVQVKQELWSRWLLLKPVFLT